MIWYNEIPRYWNQHSPMKIKISLTKVSCPRIEARNLRDERKLPSAASYLNFLWFSMQNLILPLGSIWLRMVLHLIFLYSDGMEVNKGFLENEEANDLYRWMNGRFQIKIVITLLLNCDEDYLIPFVKSF